MNDDAPLVLVADDETDIRTLVRIRLERVGYRVITAVDGEEALATARDARPDLAILDVTMPGLDGYEVTALIREDPQLAELPVVLLSAKVREQDIQRGFDAGATDYVRKPFEPRELHDCVEAILGPGS